MKKPLQVVLHAISLQKVKEQGNKNYRNTYTFILNKKSAFQWNMNLDCLSAAGVQ